MDLIMELKLDFFGSNHAPFRKPYSLMHFVAKSGPFARFFVFDCWFFFSFSSFFSGEGRALLPLLRLPAWSLSTRGGPLVSEVGYHPRKKIHAIRVVFQDKAMYAHTSFRGAKTCKIGRKGMFLVILTNFWMDMTLKLRKTRAKTRI